MAETNPIKFKQIADLKPGIDEATKNAEKFDQVFEKLFKRLSKQAQELKKTLGDVKIGTGGGAQEFKRTAKEVENLTLQQKNLKNVQTDVSGGFAKLKNKIDRLIGSQAKLNKNTRTGRERFDELQVKLIQTRDAQALLTKETKKTVQTFKQAEGSYEALIEKNRRLRQQINKFPASFNKMTAAQKRTVTQFRANTDKLKAFDKNLGQNFRNVGNYKNVIATLGKGLGKLAGFFGLAIGGAALLTAGLRAAFPIIQDFGLVMAKLRATTGATDFEFSQLEDNAKRLGATTKFTASEVGQLSLNFAKLGFTTTQILNATEATLNLATATDTDLASAAEVAGTTLRAFGLNAIETGRVTDVMAKSFTSSALDIEKFRESMKLVAPIAKAANIPIEVTTALLAQLADSGLSGSIAGTGLKNVLSKLTSPTSKLAKSLGFTVKNSEDLFRAFEILKDRNIGLAEATALTDERSKAAFLTLIGGVDAAKALTIELENSEGAAAAMAATVGDTLAGDVARLKSAFEGVVLSITGLSAGFRGAIQAATALFKVFQSTKAEAAELRKEFKAQESQFQKLDKRVTPLLNRYDELNIITELSTEEQEELKMVMEDIAAVVPLAVTEFDEYGKALGISSAAAREFIELQRLIVAKKNEDAIKAQRVAIRELSNQIIIDQAKIRKGTETIAIAGGGFVSASTTESKLKNEQLITLQSQVAVLKQKLKVELAILGELQGISLLEQFQADADNKAEDADEKKIVNVKSLRAEISKLNDQIITTEKSDIRTIRNKQRQIELIKEEIDLILGRQKEKKKDKEEDLPDDLALIEEDIQKDVTQAALAATLDRAEQLETLNDFIAQTKREGLEVTEREFNEFQKDLTNEFNAEILAAEINGLKQRIAQRELFGVERIELQKELAELEVKQAEETNKRLLDGFSDFVDESEDIFQRLLNSQIFDAAIKALGNSLLKNSQLLEEQAANAETQEQRDQLLKKAAEERQKAETKIAIIQAFTSTLRANAGQPDAVQKAIRASGETLAALTIINAFKKGGLVEGGEQIIRVNERGPEFVLDAPTTKAYGLDAPRSDMNRFHAVIENREFVANHRHSQNSLSTSLQPVNVEQPKPERIDYDKLGKAVAKHAPESRMFADIVGHLHRVEKANGKQITSIYKKRNSPLY